MIESLFIIRADQLVQYNTTVILCGLAGQNQNLVKALIYIPSHVKRIRPFCLVPTPLPQLVIGPFMKDIVGTIQYHTVTIGTALQTH